MFVFRCFMVFFPVRDQPERASETVRAAAPTTALRIGRGRPAAVTRISRQAAAHPNPTFPSAGSSENNPAWNRPSSRALPFMPSAASAAASCYVSQKWTPKWSWQTYWIVVCTMAWFLMPVGVAALATPDLWTVLTTSPSGTVWKIPCSACLRVRWHGLCGGHPLHRILADLCHRDRYLGGLREHRSRPSSTALW